jgi:hypothetical protein
VLIAATAQPPELAEDQTVPWPQHTGGLADCGGGIRDDAQNGKGNDHIEAGIQKRQPLDVPPGEESRWRRLPQREHGLRRA